MANLTSKYIDRKNIVHHVEHCTLAANGSISCEQIMEELLDALAGSILSA